LYFQKLLQAADAMSPLPIGRHISRIFCTCTCRISKEFCLSLKNETTSWKIGIKIKEKTVHSLAAFKSFIGIQKYFMVNGKELINSKKLSNSYLKNCWRTVS
jgi:hypothetical protein